MNTRRFNEGVRRKRADYERSRSSRRMRAPAHGLLGDNTNQKRQRGPTSLLSLTRTVGLKERGDRAEIRVLAESLPDVMVEQTFTAAEERTEVQFPIAEYPEQLPEQSGHTFDRGEWEDDSDDGLDEDDDYVRMMKDGRRTEYCDYRTRRDRTEKTQRHWKRQLEPGISAYADWCLSEVDGTTVSCEGRATIDLTIIDIFGSETKTIPVVDEFHSTSIIRAGYIPVAPLNHTTAFSTRTVMLYHALFVRCPRLGKQPFAKTICDILGSAFRPHLSTQLTAAFDLYVALKNGSRRRVLDDLGRGGRDYRMLNTCPPCQLRLLEDEPMAVRMVVGMDGNDSLRRVERRGDAVEVETAGEEGRALGPSVERTDTRVGGEDYFLSAGEVNAWDEANWETITEVPAGDGLSPLHRLWNEGECESRWHNAKESNTARASGNFLECGWFVLLCRHMLLLLACDMIRSGEQFKYPLSTLNQYMSAEREQRKADGGADVSPDGSLGVAYDINCKFSKTVARSPLKTLARFMLFLPVIGSMHGFAHERLCQLLFLILYIIGLGLEDGEFCERYFSFMNALAAVTRHQSVFHRRQCIAEVAYHHDNFEAYGQLSRFIVNNYKQALGILATKNTLAREMTAQGITSPLAFYEWLEEEGEYLRSLCKTPPTETLEMEYLAKLEGLVACRARLLVIREAWVLEYEPEARDTTASMETKHRHELENERKLLADVHAFEEKLKITTRWLDGDEDWVRVKAKVKEVNYRKALDKLEGLLVARIMEISRLNVAGTGYKMRKHLAKAFKNRSKTIQSAISAYNDAAKAMSPARPTVSWEELMDLSYLGEFDLLRNARDNVRERKWASQKNRVLMHQFFKLVRAEEELQRLHHEIRRLLTYMAREQELLLGRSEQLQAENPALALQIRLHWLERGRFNDLHRQRLASIKKLKGFQRRNAKYFTVGTPVGPGVDVPMRDGSSDVQEQSRQGREGSEAAPGVQVGSQSGEEDNGWAEDEEVGSDGEDVGDDDCTSDVDEEEEMERANTIETILSVVNDDA